jgi:hypothetical protein
MNTMGLKDNPLQHRTPICDQHRPLSYNSELILK